MKYLNIVGVPVEEIGYNQPAGVRYPTEILGDRSEVCMLYIGVDLGTSAVKLLLMDEKRRNQKNRFQRI